MKPRIFIGSSVEGLSVAYAIQQNLTHDSEPTVWDQGVFDLSKTTIESLTKAMDESDFGVFVFSPDDILKMRGNELNSIRDNVIFEFGLFNGRLGRDRVFFIRPDGCDLHLPTDLLGITPGSYNPKREDGRLQAATGPACNQIREAIKKLPIISSKSIQDESKVSTDSNQHQWVNDILDGNFSKARETLSIFGKAESDQDQLNKQAIMSYLEFKEDDSIGLKKLLAFQKNILNLNRFKF